MNFVESFNLFGTEAAQKACITINGAPTTSTEGAVGCLCMNTKDGTVYKCTKAVNGVYTWVQNGGMTEVGRISFPMIFEEQYDEEISWYVYPWGLQDRLIDYRNGSFLLYAHDEVEETPADFPGYETIMRLMKCPLCRVVITAPDIGDVLYHTELYDAPADGEHWETISFAHSSSVSDWTLPYSEWITGGVRLVTYDNQRAPSTACGPRAAFLRFPKEIKDALAAHTFSPGNPYEVATMTFIGYR